MDFLVGILVFALAIGLYLLPTLMASGKDIPSKKTIVLMNILLGWTVIFWIVALIMLLTELGKGNSELKRQNEELAEEHQGKLETLSASYEAEAERINAGRDQEIQELKAQHQSEIESILAKHQAEIAESNRRHLKYDGEALYIIGPSQFERIVAETIAETIYSEEEVEITIESANKDVDIFVHDCLDSELRTSAIVQCKFYRPEEVLGNDYVRNLIGSMAIHGARSAYLVTTADFAAEAYEAISRGNLNDRVFLINCDIFNFWRRQAGFAPVLYLRSETTSDTGRAKPSDS